MAISRIKTDSIQDDAVTSPKFADNPDFDGQFVRVPHGTTAQRPSGAAAGYMRFNTTIGTLEQFNTNTNGWQAIDSPPIVTSVAYSGSLTAVDPAGGDTMTVSGSNFQNGATVRVGGTTATSVSFINSTQITFVSPAKSAGDYDVVITNTNGLSATSTNGISYNGTPAFTTAAGSLGTIDGAITMPTITIVAAEPDGGTVAYSITSGSLPSGVSLGSANGQLTGAPASAVATTTFNFSVTATDNENQTTARAFSLQVLRPVYNYEIANSYHNNGTSQYLYKHSWPTATDQTRSTWSGWIKPISLVSENSSSNIQSIIWGSNTGTAAFNRIGIDSNGRLSIRVRNSSASDIIRFESQDSQPYDDTNAWYHLFFSIDFNQSGDAKIVAYVNGVLFTRWKSTSHANSGTGFTGSFGQGLGSSGKIEIGRHNANASTQYYSRCHFADIHMIDGQIKSPTDFGEFYNGVWIPKAYTGTYGNCGFKLNFADSSNMGNDVSGNNNDFTMAAGGAYSQTPDTPTNNFPQFDRKPSETNVAQIVNQNLGFLNSNTTGVFTSFALPSTGKWYWELRAGGDNFVTNITNNTSIRPSTNASTHTLLLVRNGQSTRAYNSTEVSYTSTAYANGDFVGYRWDGDAGTFKIYKNNSQVAEYNNFTLTGPFYFALDRHSSSNDAESHRINFGQDSTFSNQETATNNADSNGVGKFHYAVPSGHLALCTKNLSDSLPVSQDVRPEDFFAAHLHTGTGATQSITGLGFQPDLVWIKARNNTTSHALFDSVRGVTRRLYSNHNYDEAVEDSLTSFGADGFGLGAAAGVNANNDKFVSWNWKAGGAPTATNVAAAGAVPTSGSVMINGVASSSALAGGNPAKKISANTKSGFSIVQYTGTGNGVQTIAHGLSKAPEMMIVKNMDDDENWAMYHHAAGNSSVNSAANVINFRLNTDNIASATTNGRWGNATPTNTVFSIGDTTTDNEVGSSGDNYIAYCWHGVEGYSSFGFFEGTNQATNGAYVITGFKPAFVMVKSINGASATSYDYVVWDNKRNGSSQSTIDVGRNPINGGLLWNEVGAEITTHSINFLSNGFKCASSSAGSNGSKDYIYMAFAEQPQKYSRGR
jgi:hypothetical protein